jgi:hypothetical protein
MKPACFKFMFLSACGNGIADIRGCRRIMNSVIRSVITNSGKKIWIGRAFCFLIVLLPFLACNKATRIDVPAESPLLVLNAQWQQQSFFLVRVTRSLGISSSVDTGANIMQTYEVKNAVVTVSENNVVVDTLKYDSANYVYVNYDNKYARLNKVYTVSASLKGFTTVTASSPILPLMTISGTALKRGAGYNASGQLMDEISFSFKDDSTTADYYLIRIRNAEGDFADCINTADHDFEELVFNTPFTTETCLDGDKLLLSDENFNGSTKRVVLSVSDDQMNDIPSPGGGIRHPSVELLHITGDFFKYIKSVNDYNISNANPFAEPINLYSNILNGYGFFTAYSLSTDSLHQ